MLGLVAAAALNNIAPAEPAKLKTGAVTGKTIGVIMGRGSGSFPVGNVGIFFWNRQKLYQTVSDVDGIYKIELPEGGYMTFCWGRSGNLLAGRLEHPNRPSIINVHAGKTAKENLTARVIYMD